MKYYSIITIIIYLISSVYNNEIIVDNNLNFNTNNSFTNLNDAVSFLRNLNLNSENKIYLHSSTYDGENNNNIIIDFNLSIIGIQNPIIDCNRKTSSFKVKNAFFTLVGLTIQKCVGSRGGAIHSINSTLYLEDIRVIENQSNLGGGIYLKNSSASIVSSVFKNNIISTTSTITNCEDSIFTDPFSSAIIFSSILFCNTTSMLCNGYTNSTQLLNCSEYSEELPLTPPPTTNNQNTIGLNGWLITKYSCLNISDCTPSKTHSTIIRLDHFLQSMKEVYGIIEGYFNTSQNGVYSINLECSNLFIRVEIDNIIFFNIDFNDSDLKVERKIILNNNHSHHLKITLSSTNNLKNRMISLKIKSPGELNYKEIKSTSIENITPSAAATICGDGICNEDSKSCLIDCWGQLTENNCPPQTPPEQIQSEFYSTSDFIGTLVNNQYLYSLPGASYLAHGIDIRTGEEVAAPIFFQGYCNGSTFTLAENIYRSIIYAVPYGISVDMTSHCSYDIVSTTYSTTSSMSRQQSTEMGMDTAISANAGFFGIHASLSASLSLSKSTQSSSSLESTSSGSLSLTQFTCTVSKFNVDQVVFNQKFLYDISLLYNKENLTSTPEAQIKSNLPNLIEKYGTLYKRSGHLGGKLIQFSSTTASTMSSQSSQDTTGSVSASASAQASGWGDSAGASGSFSQSNTASNSRQASYDTNSNKSTTIIQGGVPGAYDPSSDDPITPWVDNIDALPYPVDFKVSLISDLIPSDWYIYSNSTNKLSLKTLWEEEVILLYHKYLPYKPLLYLIQEEKFLNSETLYMAYNINNSNVTIQLNNSNNSNQTIQPNSIFIFKDNNTNPTFNSNNNMLVYDLFTSKTTRLGSNTITNNPLTIKLMNVSYNPPNSNINNNILIYILTEGVKFQLSQIPSTKFENNQEFPIGNDLWNTCIASDGKYIYDFNEFKVKSFIVQPTVISNPIIQLNQYLNSFSMCRDFSNVCKSNAVSCWIANLNLPSVVYLQNIKPTTIPSMIFYPRGTGILITYSNTSWSISTACSNGGTNIFNLSCSTTTDFLLETHTINIQTCTETIKGFSRFACGVKMGNVIGISVRSKPNYYQITNPDPISMGIQVDSILVTQSCGYSYYNITSNQQRYKLNLKCVDSSYKISSNAPITSYEKSYISTNTQPMNFTIEPNFTPVDLVGRSSSIFDILVQPLLPNGGSSSSSSNSNSNN